MLVVGPIERGVPQGLKPALFSAACGTTEVVPFHDEFKLTRYLALGRRETPYNSNIPSTTAKTAAVADS
jgi:hypothetical protein